MAIIQKKIHEKYFDDVSSGKKSFELRLADWECKEGDILVLREWNPEKEEYTGRELIRKVTYVLKTKNITFFKKEDVEKYGFQILSLKEENET